MLRTMSSSIPRARGQRLDIYLSDEVYQKAIRRYRNLDAKIEQLLRTEIAREEGADAAYGFGRTGMLKPISQIVQEESASPAASLIPPPRETGDASSFELNPEVGAEPQLDAPSTRPLKRDRLPVFKPKRRGI